MFDSETAELRQIIERAREQEAASGQLVNRLAGQAPALHRAILLPGDAGPVVLMDFVIRYIELVPEFIEAIADIAQRAGITDYTDVMLNIAVDYFRSPPELLQDEVGLAALLDEAYLAHRLMEEVNDRFILRCGQPLAPMDMTRANLIVHALIGDEFANQLDMAVLYATEMLLSRDAVFDSPQCKAFAREHQQQGWEQERKRWPCLTEDLAIELSFQ